VPRATFVQKRRVPGLRSALFVIAAIGGTLATSVVSVGVPFGVATLLGVLFGGYARLARRA